MLLDIGRDLARAGTQTPPNPPVILGLGDEADAWHPPLNSPFTFVRSIENFLFGPVAVKPKTPLPVTQENLSKIKARGGVRPEDCIGNLPTFLEHHPECPHNWLYREILRRVAG